MIKRLTDVQYDFESYYEIFECVDAGENVTCATVIDGNVVEFRVEFDEDVDDYVLRDQRNTLVVEKEVNEFTLHRITY